MVIRNVRIYIELICVHFIVFYLTFDISVECFLKFDERN